MQLNEVLARFKDVKKTNEGYFVHCPAHDDEKASLNIRQDGNMILLHCFAGCDTADILKAVGLTYSDLFVLPEWAKTLSKTVIAVYDYGEYVKVRFSNKNGNKDITYGTVKNGIFSYGRKGKKPTLYKIGNISKAINENSKIFYVEGEKDVDTLTRKGYLATTAGSVTDWKKEYAEHFKGADIIVLPDNDVKGLELKDKVIQDILPFAKSVKWVLTSKLPKGDITDYFDEGHTKQNFENLLKGAANVTDDNITEKIKTLSQFKAKPIEWLWYPYIPKGKTTVLYAAPGTGKTFITCWLAAMVSTGGKFPNSETIKSGNVLMFNAEDPPSDTLISRLKGYNADLNKIYYPEDWENPDFDPYSFTDSRLEGLFREYEPKLVIFDPLVQYLGAEIDMNRANQTRPALARLNAMAQRHNTSVLIVAHTNKMTHQKAYDRLSGSVDFMAAVRSALFLGQHPNQPETKILFHVKSSLSPTGDNLAYTFKNGVLVPNSSVDASVYDADDCTKQAKRKHNTQQSLAKALIENAFKDRDKVPIDELRETAKLNGISWNTFRQSKPDNIIAQSKGFHKGDKKYFWIKSNSKTS